MDNAIKFTDPGGEVTISAGLEIREDGPWLFCRVVDNGPGLPAGLLEAQALLVQGDGSKNRKHGGLGLGLSITANILSTLGGHLEHAVPEGGGTSLSFRLPVKFSEMEG